MAKGQDLKRSISFNCLSLATSSESHFNCLLELFYVFFSLTIEKRFFILNHNLWLNLSNSEKLLTKIFQSQRKREHLFVHPGDCQTRLKHLNPVYGECEVCPLCLLKYHLWLFCNFKKLSQLLTSWCGQ